MIQLDKFQKHIVLYCKGKYHVPEGDKGFFEGLKMIWAIRCGYDYSYTSKDTLSYIANDMFKIISACVPNKILHIIECIHIEINNPYRDLELSPIETLVYHYGNVLSILQVKIKPEGKKRYQWIIYLDKPQPQLFNRILRGKGTYKDYYKVK